MQAHDRRATRRRHAAGTGLGLPRGASPPNEGDRRRGTARPIPPIAGPEWNRLETSGAALRLRTMQRRSRLDRSETETWWRGPLHGAGFTRGVQAPARCAAVTQPGPVKFPKFVSGLLPVVPCVRSLKLPSGVNFGALYAAATSSRPGVAPVAVVAGFELCCSLISGSAINRSSSANGAATAPRRQYRITAGIAYSRCQFPRQAAD